MTGPQDIPPSSLQERILAEAMIGVASELRLAEAAELVLMIGNGQSANIADLVDSSSELHFQKGSLRYALSAAYTLKWDSTPIVGFDMEFSHADLSAFFRLIIGRDRAGIEVVHVGCGDPEIDAAGLSERLAVALSAARL